MKRLLTRGIVLGLGLFLAAPPTNAWAAATLRIENPGDPSGSGYNEWPGSAIITGRNVRLHFEAYATSGLAWDQADFIGLPGWARETIFRDPEQGDPSYPSYSSTSGRGTASNPLIYDWIWDTVDQGDISRGYNGTFTIRFFAKEQFANAADCSSDSRFNCVDRKFRVNNPPSPVEWVSGPTGTKDESGRPSVAIKWSYSGNEPDMREFQIFRGGTLIATMNFAGPGTYEFTDRSFGDSGYGGTYAYSVMGLRTSSVGPNKCSTSGTYGTTCVGKSSGNRSVSLSEPPPTPGTTPGGGTPGSTPGSGGGNKGSSDPGFRPAPVGTIIVGGRRVERSPCIDCDEFYQGAYDPKLPFNTDNRYLLIPERGTKGDNRSGNRLEAVSGDEGTSAPLGVPFRDRAVLLPFAGGLLLFLTAAHVRRMLRRI